VSGRPPSPTPGRSVPWPAADPTWAGGGHKQDGASNLWSSRDLITGRRSDNAQRCPDPEARPGGVSAARPLSWANLVGKDEIEPPTLRFSAASPSSGSVRDRPPAPHPTCSVGMQADLSSGMIRIRPARCGQVGHNAGTIATAGPGDGSPDEVAGLPEHSSDMTKRLCHGAGSSSGSCWTLMRGIVCGAPGSPAQRRRQGQGGRP
jgi:hypothetical protein